MAKGEVEAIQKKMWNVHIIWFLSTLMFFPKPRSDVLTKNLHIMLLRKQMHLMRN